MGKYKIIANLLIIPVVIISSLIDNNKLNLLFLSISLIIIININDKK